MQQSSQCHIILYRFLKCSHNQNGGGFFAITLFYEFASTFFCHVLLCLMLYYLLCSLWGQGLYVLSTTICLIHASHVSYTMVCTSAIYKNPKLSLIISLVFPSVLSFPVSQFHLLRRQWDLDSFWGALAVFISHLEIPVPWSADTLVSPFSSFMPKILHLHIHHPWCTSGLSLHIFL